MPRRRRNKPTSPPPSASTPLPVRMTALDSKILYQDLKRIGVVVSFLLLLLVGIAYWQQTSTIPSVAARAVTQFLNF